jgi:hypothetical protein
VKNKLLILTLFLSLFTSSFVAPAALRRLVRPRKIKLAVAALGAAGVAVGISKREQFPKIGKTLAEKTRTLSNELQDKTKRFMLSAPVLSFAKNFYISSVLCDQDLFEGRWLPDEKDQLLEFFSYWKKKEKEAEEDVRKAHGTKKAPPYIQTLAEEARMKLMVPGKVLVRIGDHSIASGFAGMFDGIFVNSAFDNDSFSSLRHIVFHEVAHKYQLNRLFLNLFGEIQLGLLGLERGDFCAKYCRSTILSEAEADSLALKASDCWVCSMKNASVADPSWLVNILKFVTKIDATGYLGHSDIRKLALEQKDDGRLCFLHNKIAGIGFKESDESGEFLRLAASLLYCGLTASIDLFAAFSATTGVGSSHCPSGLVLRIINGTALLSFIYSVYKVEKSRGQHFERLEAVTFKILKSCDDLEEFEKVMGSIDNPLAVRS